MQRVVMKGSTEEAEGLSDIIWKGTTAFNNPLGRLFRGSQLSTDFNDVLPTNTLTQATAGTAALIAHPNGVAEFDSAAATATHGVQCQFMPQFKAVSGGRIAFEARLMFKDIATTGVEFFFGLAETDASIIASSALTAQSIGFLSVTANKIIIGSCKDGSSQTTLAAAHTMVDGDVASEQLSWVKLGCVVEGTSRANFYVNGAYVGKVTANIPTGLLRPSIVCQVAAGATADSIVWADWMQFFQERILGTY